jgi:hypothetical protein
MNQGRLEGKQVIDPRAVALVSSPHVAIPGGTNTWVSYCYGLQTGEFRGLDVIEHRGSRVGYGSHIRMIPSQRVAIIVLTNRTDGWLPATTEKAIELLLPLKPKPTEKIEAARPISPDDLTRNVGIYQNGGERLQVSARGNRLFLKFGLNPEVELTKHSESSFGTSRGEITLVAGTDSVTEYVYIGALGRSFARVR